MKETVIMIIHTDYPWKEGMSYRVQKMANQLSTKYSVTVISPILESSYSPGIERLKGYEVLRVQINLPRKTETNRLLYRLFFILSFTLSMVRIRKLFSSRKIKMVQAEQQLSLLPGFVLSFLLNAPFIVDDALAFEKYYEEYPRHLKLGAWLFEMLLFHSCRLIICSSFQAAASFPEVYRIAISKIRVIHNGVELAESLNVQLEHKNDEFRNIVFVASMYSGQNLRATGNLVKIFTAISKEVEKTRLFIIGGPTYMLREQHLENIQRLHKNIFILGRIPEEEKQQYLRTAHICPLPFDLKDKLMGGARLKALECLAYGKVVITTSAGVEGVSGAVDGVNMIIVDDFKDFEKRTIEVLRHPERYERLKRNAIQLATKYRWENVLLPYLKIVEQV
jgi:glycosyltransferase involved in cell wall biosynthesis